MKKLKLCLLFTAVIAGATVFVAADHIDAPAVTGGGSDITDFYAFQGADTDNIVFVANVQGLLSPEDSKNVSFDENVMVEINIDTNNDYIEDLVIQAVPKNKKMYFAGPFTPSQTGLISTYDATPANEINFVKVTKYGDQAIIKTSKDGLKFFAGPRDDPFFFDFNQFVQILSGNASAFNNPGTDTFAGTNVLSIVVEVPKSLIGGSGTINTWVESKRKQ